VLKNDGTVWGWGDNRQGELGDGTATNRFLPAQAQGLSGVAAIAIGLYHTLALKSDGTVWTWGNNYWGQLAAGGTTE
jgi:alpha-tubulin suppressor-like RCC1 family protein